MSTSPNYYVDHEKISFATGEAGSNLATSKVAGQGQTTADVVYSYLTTAAIILTTFLIVSAIMGYYYCSRRKATAKDFIKAYSKGKTAAMDKPGLEIAKEMFHLEPVGYDESKLHAAQNVFRAEIAEHDNRIKAGRMLMTEQEYVRSVPATVLNQEIKTAVTDGGNHMNTRQEIKKKLEMVKSMGTKGATAIRERIEKKAKTDEVAPRIAPADVQAFDTSIPYFKHTMLFAENASVHINRFTDYLGHTVFLGQPVKPGPDLYRLYWMAIERNHIGTIVFWGEPQPGSDTSTMKIDFDLNMMFGTQKIGAGTYVAENIISAHDGIIDYYKFNLREVCSGDYGSGTEVLLVVVKTTPDVMQEQHVTQVLNMVCWVSRHQRICANDGKRRPEVRAPHIMFQCPTGIKGSVTAACMHINFQFYARDGAMDMLDVLTYIRKHRCYAWRLTDLELIQNVQLMFVFFDALAARTDWVFENRQAMGFQMGQRDLSPEEMVAQYKREWEQKAQMELSKHTATAKSTAGPGSVSGITPVKSVLDAGDSQNLGQLLSYTDLKKGEFKKVQKSQQPSTINSVLDAGNSANLGKLLSYTELKKAEAQRSKGQKFAKSFMKDAKAHSTK